MTAYVPIIRSRSVAADRAFNLVTAGAAWLVLILLGATAAAMAWGGRLALETFGLGFITSTDWDAVGGKFGALVPIYGTIVTSIIALVIAVPVSLGIALFLTDIAPRWIRGPIGIAVELLAAIPSIIYGMWGLFVFCPFFARTAEPWLIERLGPLPMIGPLFRGAPIGIDVHAVRRSGVAPIINNGLCHRLQGRGRIGAGITRIPVEPFVAASDALLAAGMVR